VLIAAIQNVTTYYNLFLNLDYNRKVKNFELGVIMVLKHRSSIFNPILWINALDNIAYAAVISVLMATLYSCGVGAQCKTTDGIIFLTGIIYLLSPAHLLLSPLMGRLADFHGRQFVLLICLLLSFVGYSVLLIANNLNNVFLALLAALLLNAGTSSGAPINAAIADSYSGNQKAYSFGLIAFSTMPLYLAAAKLGEITINLNIMQIKGSNLIILLAFLLTTINIIILKFYLLRNKNDPSKSLIKNYLSLTSPLPIFNSSIVLLLILFGLFELGASVYLESMNNFFIEKNYFDFQNHSWLLIYRILLMTIGLFIFYPVILKRQSPKNILLFSLIISCIGILGSLSVQEAFLQWIFVGLFTVGEIIFIPILWTMLSDVTGIENQGLVMGIKGAVWTLAWSLGIILGHKLDYLFSSFYSIIIAMVIIFSSFILFRMIPASAAPQD